jgi:hypothetical protein
MHLYNSVTVVELGGGEQVPIIQIAIIAIVTAKPVRVEENQIAVIPARQQNIQQKMCYK